MDHAKTMPRMRYARLATLAMGAMAAAAAAQPDASESDYLGTLARDTQAVTIQTTLSDFDTELALFDASGVLIAQNDDANGTTTSQIDAGLLDPGRYWIAATGFNATFADGFTVLPGSAAGDLRVRVISAAGNASSNVALATGRVHWVTFDVVGIPPVPPNIGLGIVGEAGESIAISTGNSSVRTSMALFNSSGTVIAENDDFSIFDETSRIVTPPLDAGEYYLAVHTDSAFFIQGFIALGWRDSEEGPIEVRVEDRYRLEHDFTDETPLLIRLTIREACVLGDCPPGALQENEPAFDVFDSEFDVTNAGCGANPALFTEAILGQTWCGLVRTQRGDFPNGTSGGVRDVDWYEVYLPQPTLLDLGVEGGTDGEMFLVAINAPGPDCGLNDVELLDEAPLDTCAGPAAISGVYLPGRYAVAIAPSFFDSLGPTPYTLSITGTPVAQFDLGPIGQEFELFDLSTIGSNFDTELALYDAQGNLIADDDDGVSGSTLSLIPQVSLPAGEYYAVVTGFNVAFGPGFGIDLREGALGSGGGDAVVNIGGFSQPASVPQDRAVWVRFRITPQGPCSPADLAAPFGTLTFADISAFLGAFAVNDPAADLAAPFGFYTFADISAFLAAFAGGCP